MLCVPLCNILTSKTIPIEQVFFIFLSSKNKHFVILLMQKFNTCETFMFSAQSIFKINNEPQKQNALLLDLVFKITQNIRCLKQQTFGANLEEEILHRKPWKTMQKILFSWRTEKLRIRIRRVQSKPRHISKVIS